ncbi:MAG: FG-GAP repeat protein, partial [Phycisphaerae bacterium]|nr:FG-GAP repeat protein [Phycisphaerae bacterium]
TDAGSAYVYTRSGGVWTEQDRLAASDAAAVDRFGYSVALSGDTAVVGAMLDDHAGGTDAGSAYIFDQQCCCAGDMNADGTVDGSDIPLFVNKLLTGGACP